MMPVRSRNVPPNAGAMIESLRGLGYTPAGALADVIDNSIAAGSTEIALFFTWSGGNSQIAIVDNGHGMDGEELERAMRLGDRNPLEQRSANDLGRFGMGLKTASFSQCRRLTVASKRNGGTHCLRWDLDVLAASRDGGWHLLEGPAEESTFILDHLARHSSGTVVAWERLDRIVTAGFSEQDFLDLIDRIEHHLSVVFHRYLSGMQPHIRITINGRSIAPWDPFLAAHPATWSSPLDKLTVNGSPVEVQCHVLPHRDRMDAQTYKLTAGPEGWTAHQGFYVYRNKRLLVAGSWLGLGEERPWTREEAYRLARIRLDILNETDADWKIDIRKSTARPPAAIRYRLMRIAQDVRERARRVFAHRGQIVPAAENKRVVQAWRAEYAREGMRYRIDLNHPAVKAVMENVGDLTEEVTAMLRVIEETIPIQRIWLDTTEAKDMPRTGFSSEPPAEIVSVLKVMYRNLTVRKALSPELAREQLLRTEPFHNFPDLIKALTSNGFDSQ